MYVSHSLVGVFHVSLLFFLSGANREDARRSLVHALSELVIRGEIHNSVEFVRGLLEKDEFREDKHTTQWLDGIIARGERATPPPFLLAVVCRCVQVTISPPLSLSISLDRFSALSNTMCHRLPTSQRSRIDRHS